MDIKSEIELSGHERTIVNKFRTFMKAGPGYDSVFIVGGWVRDKLLGHSSKDLDFSYKLEDESRLISDVLVSFSQEPAVAERDSKLSVVAHRPPFVIEQEPVKGFLVNVIEVADFGRKNHFKLDLRALKGESAEADSLSRDFTINAVYYDVLTGEVVDPRNVR